MHEFLIYTVSGLTTAGIYAITASGLTLTYTTTGIFNFAQGAVGMVAAFCYWQLRFDWGWPAPVAAAMVLLVVAPLFGAFLEITLMRRLEGTSEVTKLVVTVALLLGLVSLALQIWDPAEFRIFRPAYAGHIAFTLGDIRVSVDELLTFSIALGVALGLWLLLKFTRIGVAMRATVDDRGLVGLFGSRPARASRAAWMIGTSLAALAGILVAPNLALSPLPITLLIVNAYAAAVIGRLRSLPMTFVGALVLGLANDYAIGYVPKIHPPLFPYVQSFPTVIPVAVLFVALLLMPQSRLRGHAAQRSREIVTKPTWPGAAIFAACVVGGTVMVATVVQPGDLFSMTKMWGLGIVGLSMIPLVGYGGRISLCQLSFAGVGAAVVGHLGSGGDPLVLLLAGLVAGALGAVVALPALRLSGIYLALATAAFAVAMDRWLFILPRFTIFGDGIALFPSQSLSFDRFHVLGIDVTGDQAYLIFGAVVFCAMAFVVVWVARGRFGLRLLAAKDSPAACATVGMNLRASTLGVFTLSAAMAGIGGGIYAVALRSAAFNQFDFFTGLSILLVMVVAGISSIGAAIAVAVFLGTPLYPNLVEAVLGPGLAQATQITVAFAGIGLGMNPNGFIPQLRRHWNQVPRTPRLAFGFAVAIVGLWVLDVSDVIDNWTFALGAVLLLAVLPLASRIALRRRPAPQPSETADGRGEPGQIGREVTIGAGRQE